MKISLTNIQDYVIIGRNQNLSNFYIKPKSVFEKDNNPKVILSTEEGCFSENHIINMMDNSEFFTYSNNSYTKVIVVNNHIKSVPNGTTVDNLVGLPIICQ